MAPSNPPPLVILPTYDEAPHLSPLVHELLALPHPLHILVVDDASPDGTGALADALARQHPERCHVLHRPHKRGLGRAYAHAFAWALARDYPLIAHMDADRSHDPQDLPTLLAASAHADLVLGSRHLSPQPPRPTLRRLLTHTANLYLHATLGPTASDPTSGFRVWRRHALSQLHPLHTHGYAIQIETLHKAHTANLRITEVPIRFTPRQLGRSKLSPSNLLEALHLGLQLRAHRPPSSR